MRYKAVIFDMDGTLIDSERLVIEAGLAAFRAMDLPERRDVLTDLIGTVGEAAPTLRAAFGAAFDHEGFGALWDLEVQRMFASGIPLRPGADELLGLLADSGVPVALATNSRTQTARESLRSAGIAHRFPEAHVWGRDRVDRPKPAPDLYLRAAEGLGVAPADCLAFEDSDVGTVAALAAGMTVIQIPDQRPPATRDAHILAESLLDGARAAGVLPAA
ncbi:HAD family hydrolase [Wenxinia marina]|uniref:Haloacid dehalogenase superfamily, subfamily IA, variant 3 with third motif having DD or ED n=1 Tax=Wenxinia marina DSM 24838 TaxID=1123501 RepID=A0A0D0QEN3_9RHOB|nr:HAD family phosphatase [Wenxinia marina]KIQ70797.1 haloacid dehalogenase superfamily, subfamily IA, variant 3 with third motif having DD or ED [Wenxinia marina DSM 24838]GGL57220.1 haloacid dehalogenase [Wenxinia marina]